MTSKTERNYILGQSEYEYERLTFQARIVRPFTDKFFRLAGVGPGMRVLEMGSGMGDVAFLAGDIVRPGGWVLGVDQDAAGLEKARERSRQQGCSSWVSFEASSLTEFDSADQFDAIVGRYILLYQQDPGAIIRRLLKFLKARRHRCIPRNGFCQRSLERPSVRVLGRDLRITQRSVSPFGKSTRLRSPRGRRIS